jgi:hypothetical protein
LTPDHVVAMLFWHVGAKEDHNANHRGARRGAGVALRGVVRARFHALPRDGVPRGDLRLSG